MKTFEECLNEMALKAGFASWNEMDNMSDIYGTVMPHSMLEAAVHIFTTAAIKADRQQISKLCLNGATIHEGISFSCPFDPEMIHSLPIQL